MNLPNKLTMLRIGLVPVYLLLMWASEGLGVVAGVLALVVFCVAAFTDLLDGKIAREQNLVTNFGKFMDPIADKLLTHTAFIMLCSMGYLNVWVCILFIAREFIVSGLRLVAVEQNRVIAAGMSGKIKTVLQMSAVILLTIESTIFAGFHGLASLTVVAAAVMTFYSMVEYVWQNRAVLR